LYQHHAPWQAPCTSTKWCWRCGGTLPLSSSIVVVPDELMAGRVIDEVNTAPREEHSGAPSPFFFSLSLQESTWRGRLVALPESFRERLRPFDISPTASCASAPPHFARDFRSLEQKQTGGVRKKVASSSSIPILWARRASDVSFATLPRRRRGQRGVTGEKGRGPAGQEGELQVWLGEARGHDGVCAGPGRHWDTADPRLTHAIRMERATTSKIIVFSPAVATY